MTDQSHAFEILLRLLAATHSEEIDLSEPIPWEEIVALAQANGASALLYARIREADHALPAGMEQDLRSAYYGTACQNAVRFHELGQVVSTLGNAGVPVILLKGAALAETVYGNVSVRPMCDLDLLIPRDRIQEIPGILAPLGYQVQSGSGYTFDFDARFCGEAVLYKMSSAAPVFLDVHWHLVAVEWFHHTTRLDVEALWQAARPLELDRLSALQLDCEDTLLHLCVHAGISHSYTSLSNLIDIDRVVTAHPDLDWERFLRRVRAFQVQSAVYFGLHFARALFCTPVPDPVVRDLGPSALRRRLVRRLVDPAKIALRLQPPLSRRSRYLLHLAMIDDACGVFRLLRYLFLPGDEWLAMRYNLMGPAQVRRARFWHPFRALRMGFAAFFHLFRERVWR